MMAFNNFTRKFIDIGANLTDSMYQGFYNSKIYHQTDIKHVIQRSINVGIEKILVTAGTLEDTIKALEIIQNEPILFTTAGFHPTRCLILEKNPKEYIESLIKLCLDNREKVVAVGEFGLDYDRLEFCPKDIQLRNFIRQFEIVERTKLPMFLHCRNAADDLLEILRTNRNKFTTGVVHSFDGSYEEAMSFIDLGLYIGLNGCSLKTEQNLEVVKKLPIEKLMIETDCPYCEIKTSHSSFKYIKTKFDSVKKEKWCEDKLIKGRNEPCKIIQILEVISQLKNADENHLSQIFYDNTMKVFFSK